MSSVTLAGTAGCSPVQRDPWSLLRLSPHSPFRPPHLDTIRLPISDFKHSVYCWRNLQALNKLRCYEKSVCITNSSLLWPKRSLEIVLSMYWCTFVRTDSLRSPELDLREHHSRFHYPRSLAFWRACEVFHSFSQNWGRKIVLDQFFSLEPLWCRNCPKICVVFHCLSL